LLYNLKNKIIEHLQLILVMVFIIITIVFSQILKSDNSSSIIKSNEIRKIPVEQINIKQKDYFLNFKINGFVTTGAKIQLIPQVSGRISKVSDQILAGSVFDKDQILFQIEPVDFELNITKIKSKLKQNESNLKLRKAEYKVAISEWRGLNGKKSIPDLVSKKPALDAAKAVLNATEADLQIAKIKLQRAKFSLPFAGKILSSNIAKGQFIQSGKSLGEVFDIEAVEIESSLNKEELKWLKIMDQPKILIHIQDKKTYHAEIARISGVLDPKTRFTNIVFKVSNEDRKHLIAGQFIEIEITNNNPMKVLHIPIESLQENDNIWEIVDMKLKNRIINIIQITKDYVIVLSDKKNINIAKGNLLGSSEGDLVKIIK
jgi:RND family efflux transporter MFP subunit